MRGASPAMFRACHPGDGLASATCVARESRERSGRFHQVHRCTGEMSCATPGRSGRSRRSSPSTAWSSTSRSTRSSSNSSRRGRCSNGPRGRGSPRSLDGAALGAGARQVGRPGLTSAPAEEKTDVPAQPRRLPRDPPRPPSEGPRGRRSAPPPTWPSGSCSYVAGPGCPSARRATSDRRVAGDPHPPRLIARHALRVLAVIRAAAPRRACCTSEDRPSRAGPRWFLGCRVGPPQGQREIATFMALVSAARPKVS
jgi:hypothetical protein